VQVTTACRLQKKTYYGTQNTVKRYFTFQNRSSIKIVTVHVQLCILQQTNSIDMPIGYWLYHSLIMLLFSSAPRGP